MGRMIGADYLEFEVIETKPKTKVYGVTASMDGELLGQIKWFGPWRQYVFEPYEATVYSHGCMKQIEDFIKNLMEERRKQWKTGRKKK